MGRHEHRHGREADVGVGCINADLIIGASTVFLMVLVAKKAMDAIESLIDTKGRGKIPLRKSASAAEYKSL